MVISSIRARGSSVGWVVGASVVSTGGLVGRVMGAAVVGGTVSSGVPQPARHASTSRIKQTERVLRNFMQGLPPVNIIFKNYITFPDKMQEIPEE